MSDGKEFLKEAKEVRNEFVKIAGQYSVSEHLELRTEIDTLLIMYDQACERVRVGSKPETSASTCNLQSVTHSALLEASKAIVSNIETWLDTGDPADSKTSKMLYDNLKKAIVDVEHCG